MRKAGFGTGVLLAVMLAAPLMAVMYLAAQLAGLAFAPFQVFDWVSRLLPGPVITFGIDALISTLTFLRLNVADFAKTAEQMLAVGVFFVVAVVAGWLYFAAASREKVKPGVGSGLIAGALFGLPVMAVSISLGDQKVPPLIDALWLLALFAGWGVSLAWASGRLLRLQTPAEAGPAEVRRVQRNGRREFLITLGTATAAVTIVGSGLAAVLERALGGPDQSQTDTGMAHQDTGEAKKQLPNLDDPVSPAPGTRPEYTPLKDFYRVFIQLEPTEIDASTWSLPITGMVDHPLMLTLGDLRTRYPAHDQYATLNCISGRIPTTLISTTLWTGASLLDVLADAQVRPEARYLHIMSGDGFYETVDLELVRSEPRILLCYAWDGNPLPVDHGFPLRIWIPDRFGMKQPKWITAIEVSDTYKPGYWVERGWDEVAQVKTRSVIDTVAVDAVFQMGSQQMVPVGGIAFAGARGISKVEVRVDGGAWQPARLRAPLSETTWVIWRYDWPFEDGAHTLEVRCYERDGTPQIAEINSPRPSGATGIHKVDVSL